MTLLTRWMSTLTLAPLAVLTLQGVPLAAQAFNDLQYDAKEAAADRAAARLGASPLPARPAASASGVPGRPAPVPTAQLFVPPSAKRLDAFRPVLPPERALGLAMAQAHAQAQAHTPSGPTVAAAAPVAATERR